MTVGVLVVSLVRGEVPNTLEVRDTASLLPGLALYEVQTQGSERDVSETVLVFY